ncbi:hypothetical protein [Pseudomonas syringae pv. coryli]|uniref:hypothetical protein n=1 Tax=Pseudomonas syringae pv. coryli TaxID=317659 RepID=UPI003D2E6EF0
MSAEFINNDVRNQIQALEEREAFLKKRTRRVIIAWACVAVTAVFVWVVTFFLGPDASISTVDIPHKLIEELSDTAVNVYHSSGSGSSISGGLASVTSVTNSMVGMMQPLLIGIAVIYGLFNIVVGLATGESDRFFRGIVATIVIGSAGFVFNVFIGHVDGGETTTTQSEREQFSDAVASKSYNQVLTKFKLGQAGTPEAIYVLAQVVLSDDKLRVNPPMPIDGALVQKIAEAPKNDWVKPQVLYAIETEALGSPVTEKAVAYRAEKLAQLSGVRTMGFTATVFAMVLAAIAIGFASARVIITNRLKRIEELLSGKATI